MKQKYKIISEYKVLLKYGLFGKNNVNSYHIKQALNTLEYQTISSVISKEDQVKITSIVDAEDPQDANPSDIHVSGETYRVQLDIADNYGIWDMTTEVEYEDLSIVPVTPVHVTGDTYQFTFTIPDEESAELTVTAKDVAGRTAAFIRTVDNPPDVPELGTTLGIAVLILIPLAMIPIILKKKKQKKT